MKKKIDVLDLQKGMYVSELDRPWLETPFLFQGFRLTTDEEIEQVRKQCKYVFIDIIKGIDVSIKRSGPGYEERMRNLRVEEEKIRRDVQALAEAPLPRAQRKPYQDTSHFEEEIVQAKEVEKHARETMHSVIEDVGKGRNVDVVRARSVVSRMVDSVIRNPDALVCLTQLRDLNEYTALHSIRCTILGVAFGRHLVFSKDEMIALGMGLLMHDIGMVRVPKHILEKPGGLTPEEFEIMRRHVNWGVEILQQSGDVPPLALQLVQHHHERRDGAGYPNQLKGDAISPAGLIGSIIDVYDAVTSDRTYSGGMSAEDTLKRMYEWREKDFHPQLVEEYIKCMGVFPIGSLVELSTGSVGVVITVNRARRLKPKVALVLTASKQPYSQKMYADLAEHKDMMGQDIKINRVLPAGTYGIHPMDHIVQL